MAVTRVSVRELAEFSERGGDINFRFSSRSSALAGIRGHQRLQKRRGEGYVAEQAVRDEVTVEGGTLEITGRVDGYFPDTSPLIVDEIKTVRGDATQIPESVTRVHRGQARVYATLLARELGAESATVRVCYLQLDDDSEVIVEETLTAGELEQIYRSMLETFAAWERRNRAWRVERDATIETLAVPFGGFRPGQREMAITVWRTLRDGGQSVIQAPTGIGKSLASLYPSVRALAFGDDDDRFDKVFFLTAKGPGQAAARDAVSLMRNEGLKLTDVTLTAREKACFNPGAACHPEQCAYASGYYDRLPGVLEEALGQNRSFTADEIAELAEEKGMCPFELGLDLSTIADVVIADYNYAFDPWVHLRRFFGDVDRRYAFLIDEAHNLVDRGRDMFSASLDKQNVLAVRRSMKAESPAIYRRLGAVNRQVLDIKRESEQALAAEGYATIELPTSFLRALREFCEAAEEWLAEGRHDDLLQLYFDASRFVKTGELVDDGFRCVIEDKEGGIFVRIIAVNPAAGLRDGFSRSSASIAFSATLSPQPYFREQIGAGEDAGWYSLQSPFDESNLGVFVTSHIGTTWRERDDSLDEVVHTIDEIVTSRRGNYLVFFPSHPYLQRAFERFRARSAVRSVMQSASMSPVDRAAFLAEFEQSGDDPVVGFGVTGGMFSEGVDLQGERLIGVIVVGVGMPAPSPERKLISEHFDDLQDPSQSFRFAYQYPGMNRVLQAAGRVIRSATDRGIVCLIDRRFNTPDYAGLLPESWQVNRTSTRHELATAISAFWNDDGTCAERHDNHPRNHAGSPDGKPADADRGDDGCHVPSCDAACSDSCRGNPTVA